MERKLNRFNARNIVCILLTVFVCFLICSTRANAYEETKTCDFTCYVDKGICFTGCETRKGIAASSEELIGYTAIVYTEEGDFIGYYEILDKIGTEWGRSGTLEEPHVIDIWCEDMAEAHELMKRTSGKCKIILVWAEG